MLDRSDGREESPRVQYAVSKELEPRAAKLVSSRFDPMVLGVLSITLGPGAAGYPVTLLDRLDRDPEADRAAFSLLYRVSDGDAFDEHILGKALSAIDRSPAITL